MAQSIPLRRFSCLHHQQCMPSGLREWLSKHIQHLIVICLKFMIYFPPKDICHVCVCTAFSGLPVASGKNCLCNKWDTEMLFDPWIGKISGRKSQPLVWRIRMDRDAQRLAGPRGCMSQTRLSLNAWGGAIAYEWPPGGWGGRAEENHLQS